MNFCGAEYDAQVDIQDTKLSATVLCLPCVKDDDERLKEVFSDDDEDEDVDNRDGKAPLDIIEETIDNKKSDEDDDDDDDDEEEALVKVLPLPGRLESASTSSNPGVNTTPGRASAVDSSTTTPVLTSRTSKCLDSTSTPSPIYLNPMSDDDWNGPTRQSTIRSDLRCPLLEPLPPPAKVNRLVKRLEGGFRVQFYHPGQSTKESVLLYLDQERNKICLQTDEEKKEDEVNFWLELPMEKILRLEIGGKGSLSCQLTTFAILVSQDSRIVYYDFVASSPIERELIVSTLMSVIDRNEEDEKKSFASDDDDADGCDTSLVEQKFSSIVKSIEERSCHSVKNSTKVFDDRSICSAPARGASLAEKEQRTSQAGKKFTAMVKRIDGKHQTSPPITDRKGFSSFKDRASHTLSEKRSVSSSAKSAGAERTQSNLLESRVSFNTQVTEIHDLRPGMSSKEKKNLSTRAKSQSVIKAVEERKQRILAGKRGLLSVVESLDSEEHNFTEREPIQIVPGVDDTNQSRSTHDDFGDPARSVAEKEEECVVLDDVKDEPGEVTIVEDDKKDNGSSKVEQVSDDDFTFGGTHDAPIPCSPSLEQQLSLHSEFSPRRSTQLFNDGRDKETEATLVIHLEDMLGLQDDDGNCDDKKVGTSSTPRSSPADLPQEEYKPMRESQQPGTPKKSITTGSNERSSSSRSVASNRSAKTKTAKDVESPNRKIQRKPSKDSSPEQSQKHIRASSPRPTPETMHLTGSFGGGSAPNPRHKKEVSLAANARAEDLMVEFASSSGHLASAWCADNDICTSALKDITDTCTSVFALKQAEATCNIPDNFSEQQALIEEYVANALDAPSAVYSYLIEGEKWTEEKTSDEEEQKLTVNGRVRNRSSVSNAQALRLRRLRSEMTFTAALKRSKDNMQYVQTTKSFDDAKVLGSKTDSTDAVKRFHSSALLKSVVGTMMSSNMEQGASDEEVAYYDSDPEDARPRTLHKRCPRQTLAELSSEEGAGGGIRKGKTLSSAFDKVKSTKRVSKKLDEETIVQMVQTMTNERMTLIWHPTQREKLSNRAPLCVKVWIEAGVCLVDGTFVLPKLCWSKVMDKDDSDDNAAGIGQLLGRDEPDKVDLLDICRVHATKSVDRQRHPFADARKSFFVETQADTILFEALTYEERDRIVYGLKLVIARLASLLMLRDVRAAEEFFGAVAPPVPGEAPQWVQGRNKSPSTQQHPQGAGGLLPTMNK